MVKQVNLTKDGFKNPQTYILNLVNLLNLVKMAVVNKVKSKICKENMRNGTKFDIFFLFC